ncbi:lytic transglycosylase [Caldanaerobacter subterraneus subsp. yonseiensis KB-1]|uniref:Lytic transglycosylase n=2 Tax=Caldanaerobacter subterraneus TaxID=911092 RepID=U5CJ81_CALSX|nr:lytic transglycosylase [Caldanaerobacter subterraneus subsp. yonseiensis KB-1]
MIKRWVLFLLIILAILLTFEMNTHYFLKKFYPLKYEEYVNSYSKEFGLDPYLVFAIIKVESNFNPYAISNRNAIGLMQIMPDTGRWIAAKLGMKDFKEEILFNPEVNIKMGVWYLHYLLKNFDGNLKLALAAYNGGCGNVDLWLKDKRFSQDGRQLHSIPFPETDRYVKKVLAVYRMYKFIYTKK